MRERVPSPPRLSLVPGPPLSPFVSVSRFTRCVILFPRAGALSIPPMGSFFFFLIFSSLDLYDPCVQRDHVFKVLRPNKQTNVLHFSLFPCIYLSPSLFSRTLHFHRFFVIPSPPLLSPASRSCIFLPCVFPACSSLPTPTLSLFILCVSIVRTTINKPLIGLTPISGALFEVNEKPMVPRPPLAFFNVSSFLSRYLHRPSFLAICHCRSLKCGLMTIYHLCYSRKSFVAEDAM